MAQSETINLHGLQRDFQVHQGNDINFVMELFDVSGQPLDMTGMDLFSEWRDALTGKVVFTLTIANGKFSWKDQTGGKINVRIPASESSSKIKFPLDLDVNSVDIVYDIEVHSNNPTLGTFKPYFGTATFMRELTRIA